MGIRKKKTHQELKEKTFENQIFIALLFNQCLLFKFIIDFTRLFFHIKLHLQNCIREERVVLYFVQISFIFIPFPVNLDLKNDFKG